MKNIDEVKEQLSNTESAFQDKKAMVKEAKEYTKRMKAEARKTKSEIWKIQKELRQLTRAERVKTPGIFSRIACLYRAARLGALKDAHDKYLQLTNQSPQPTSSVNEVALAQQLLNQLSELEAKLSAQK